MVWDQEQDNYPRPRRSKWGWIFSWPTLVLLALLVYELTSQGSLSIVILCCKLGFKDLRTFFWVRRHDPDQKRGRTCSWFFLAWGLWKITLPAFLLMVLLGVLNIIFHQPNGVAAIFYQFLEAFLTALIGFPLAFIASMIATSLIWRHLPVEAYDAQGYRTWPLWLTEPSGIISLALVSFFFLFFFPVFLGLLFGIAILLGPNPPAAVMIPVSVLLVVGLCAGFLSFRDLLCFRIHPGYPKKWLSQK